MEYGELYFLEITPCRDNTNIFSFPSLKAILFIMFLGRRENNSQSHLQTSAVSTVEAEAGDKTGNGNCLFLISAFY